MYIPDIFPFKGPYYAHIEIVVAFLVVKNFGFLVIARYHTIRISRKLEEIFLSASRSFLDQNFRNQTVGKPKFKGQNFRVNPKKSNEYYLFNVKTIKNKVFLGRTCSHKNVTLGRTFAVESEFEVEKRI